MLKHTLVLIILSLIVLLYSIDNSAISKVSPGSQSDDPVKQTLTVQITTLPSGQIRLSWNAMTGATGYNIYQCNSAENCSSPSWLLIVALPSSSLSYQFTPTSSKRFYYVTYDSALLPPHFVEVDGGTFNNGYADMTISSFIMDKYEMTQSSYQAVMGVNPANSYGVGANKPVYFVSWFNAIEFCNRRSMQEGLNPCYTYYGCGTNPDNWPSGWNTNDNNQSNIECNWIANGYRLPTAMEWIFAARGGNLSHDYPFSGSDNADDVAWWGYYVGGDSDFGCHDIGLKTPNELGIYDMSGNVYEWVWDLYGDYPTTPQTNPHGPETGVIHEFHGGCWGWFSDWCNVFYRRYNGASDTTMQGVGIRLVRNLQ
ncbi:MAG TPA: SUMF1/EgtB/PvdO family nonheme iron enzyme [Candidatus Cloacimonadota bacterium]|nr:SUMF1/EgtB/PvdO family nonheme iron enzyme [Candidatus Cloacimonadota bacterium]HPT72298.1 SUMF1/EgtB/PvdO family nonheme iron enzyme [Candidatus Cloacimonadota bacterium]